MPEPLLSPRGTPLLSPKGTPVLYPKGIPASFSSGHGPITLPIPTPRRR